MRAFLFLSSVLVVASAATQSGYNYQHNVQIGIPKLPGPIFSQRPTSSLSSSSSASSSSSSASLGSFTSSGSGSSGHEGHNFLKQALYQSPKLTQNLLSSYQRPTAQQSFNLGAVQQQPVLLPPTQHQTHYQPQSAQHHHGHQHQPQQILPPVVTKDIYVHVAPEEPEERRAPGPVPIAPPPRKHYRIVFIKAPTHSASKTALHLQHAPVEEKTIIYVLTKKPDPIELEAAFQDIAPKPPSKPEVYFIKYKTQEEAQHAQRTIQAQYDQLGGTTQVSDEGVAPVTSVIGSLDHLNHQHTGSVGHTSIGSGSGSGSGASAFGGSGFGGNLLTTGSGSGSSSSSSGGVIGSKYLPPIRV